MSSPVPIAELDMAIALVDVEAHVPGEDGLRLFRAGTPGTVVLVHAGDPGAAAYEIEFPLTGGRGALATLTASEVRRMPPGYRRACPCCGYRSLAGLCPGSGEVCPVCLWMDDPGQWERPDEAGGANRVSLLAARANYAAFGACEREALSKVRQPLPGEIDARA